MIVDHARVVLRMKEHILSKRSHGSRELLEKLAELEVESQIPEAEEGFDPTPPRRLTGTQGYVTPSLDSAAPSAAS